MFHKFALKYFITMLIKRSTKGIKRGPYKKRNTGFEKYVADVFCERIYELDITQTQLLEDTGNKVSAPSLSRVLNGHGGTNINTIATIADMLGLEIIIRPKQEEDENND